MRRGAALGALVLVLAVEGAACRPSGDAGAADTSAAGADVAATTAVALAPTVADSSHHGASGHATATADVSPARSTAASESDDVGSFGVRCAYSHRAPDDPIVHPGMPGASHLHEFFGSVTAGATSTAATLLASDTTCDSSGDRSAYWVPQLEVDGAPVAPIEAAAYYRAAPGTDATLVVAPPDGLELISTGAAWACARTDVPSDAPPACPPTSLTRLVLTFPDCWDGEALASADHHSHVAASTAGECPATHPVPIPQLVLEVRYPAGAVPPGAALAFSSGEESTAHGDALLAWERSVVEREVRSCVQRRIVCDLTWNTVIGGY
jgi:hypothetical protein